MEQAFWIALFVLIYRIARMIFSYVMRNYPLEIHSKNEIKKFRQ